MSDNNFSWKMNKNNWISFIILSGFTYIMNGSRIALMIGFIPAIISCMISSFIWIYIFKLIRFVVITFKKYVHVVD